MFELGGDVGRDFFEVSDAEGEGIQGVTAADGEGVGTVGVFGFPDIGGFEVDSACGEEGHGAAEDLTYIAFVEEFFEMEEDGVALGLETDHGVDVLAASGGVHGLSFGEGSAEGPFAEDVLAGGEGGQDHFVVEGDSDGYGDYVKVGLLNHLSEVVEIARDTVVIGGGFSAFGLTGAEGSDMEFRRFSKAGKWARPAQPTWGLAPMMPIFICSCVMVGVIGFLSVGWGFFVAGVDGGYGDEILRRGSSSE